MSEVEKQILQKHTSSSRSSDPWACNYNGSNQHQWNINLVNRRLTWAQLLVMVTGTLHSEYSLKYTIMVHGWIFHQEGATIHTNVIDNSPVPIGTFFLFSNFCSLLKTPSIPFAVLMHMSTFFLALYFIVGNKMAEIVGICENSQLIHSEKFSIYNYSTFSPQSNAV